MSYANENVNAYSPEGRLYQIEYAMKAANLGTNTLGFIVEDKVVLISEKKIINKHQLKESIKKHLKIYDHIVVGASGVAADAKDIVLKARNEALSHARIYNENIPVEKLLKHLCNLALKFGEKELSKKLLSRPFGSSFLVASFENGKPLLYLFDPSGSYRGCNAKALGNAMQVLEGELENKYPLINELNSGLLITLQLFKDVMREKLDKENIEISILDKNGIKLLEINEISELISQLK